MMIRRNTAGFTLVELMVAMAIATLVLSAIYAAFNAQMRRYTTEQQVVEMQQNIRAAMYLLKKDLRLAGYSPADPPVNAGFVADFLSFGAPHDGCGAVTDGSDIAFTVLHGGRLTEMGSHRELLERDGRYAHLFRLQAQGYLD